MIYLDRLPKDNWLRDGESHQSGEIKKTLAVEFLIDKRRINVKREPAVIISKIQGLVTSNQDTY